MTSESKAKLTQEHHRVSRYGANSSKTENQLISRVCCIFAHNWSINIILNTCILDAVGSSQIFCPTQNLERAYQVDKESKAVLSYFQYDQCAGPQKQEDINGHSSTIVGKKIKARDVFLSGNQGNFLVLNKKIPPKKIDIFFQLKSPKTQNLNCFNQHCAYFLL